METSTQVDKEKESVDQLIRDQDISKIPYSLFLIPGYLITSNIKSASFLPALPYFTVNYLLSTTCCLLLIPPNPGAARKQGSTLYYKN